MSFSVLFVCTGNICRSPVAEKLFRARLIPGSEVTASSAGTFGLEGYEMDGPSALALSEIGVDPEGHVARRITIELVQDADLILTASDEHRSVVLREAPRKMTKVFTLREFGRLAGTLPEREEALAVPSPDLLRQRVRLIASQRGLVPPAAPGSDDISDPFGATIDTARRCVADVSAAVDAALATLHLHA